MTLPMNAASTSRTASPSRITSTPHQSVAGFFDKYLSDQELEDLRTAQCRDVQVCSKQTEKAVVDPSFLGLRQPILALNRPTAHPAFPSIKGAPTNPVSGGQSALPSLSNSARSSVFGHERALF